MYKIDKEKVYWRFLEGETILLNIESGNYFTLDEIGTMIWDMIASKKTELQIKSKIIQEYAIDEKTAAKDIKKFIEHLRKSKLIEK